MAAAGEGPLIAVDVTARFQPAGPVRRGRPRARRLAGRAREVVVGSDEPVPRLRETLIRTVLLGSIDTAAAAQAHADAVIEPEVEGFGLTEFGELDRLVAAGRDATRAKLETVRAAADAATRRSERADGPEGAKGGIRAHDHAS
jgi:predicted acylesterase/phospholipase RssA